MMALDLERSEENGTWQDLMADGRDIVDRLNRVDVASSRERSDTLRIAAEKVLTGIGRCEAYREWKRLHDSVAGAGAHVEDGAIALAAFYERSSDRTDGQIMHDGLRETVLEKLDGLADVILGRLHERLGDQIECPYPMLEILEEMKFLFDNGTDGDNPAAFRGNVDDYYDHANSLVNRCLERRTGIPITLAVIYSAVVRRVCGGGGRGMDIIGLPGHIVLGVPSDDTRCPQFC